MRLPDALNQSLEKFSGCWLVTGAAGFIGSHLVQALLERGQTVRGLDNFSTGNRGNLDQIRAALPPSQWARFALVEGDICDRHLCGQAVQGVEFVLHQAALGSVPLSIQDPVRANDVNVGGTLHLLAAAKDAGVRRFVYASSCAVYGDCADLPLQESRTGHGLSPYAVTKQVNELYARVFERCYGLPSIGLRYFNIFGPRQDPNGAYAAVIPAWIAAMMTAKPVRIYGDGETSRDFCYVGNVVQANLLAALQGSGDWDQHVFNVGSGRRTSLNQLFSLLRDRLVVDFPHLKGLEPAHVEFRSGDIRHSQGDIASAGQALGYVPEFSMEEGMDETLAWHTQALGKRGDR